MTVVCQWRFLLCAAQIFTMSKNIEQRICLKFCVANEISFTNAFKMLQKVYGNDCRKQVRLSDLRSFKKDENPLKTTHALEGHQYQRMTFLTLRKWKNWCSKIVDWLREIADEVGISFGSCQQILSNEHETGRIAIPKNLNFLQKENRVLVSSEMISTVPETAHTWNGS